MNLSNPTAFWDSAGLSQLKNLSTGDADQRAKAAKEASKQFEAILLNELLKEARKNNIAGEDNPFNSEAMKNFQGMFDQQVAHSMAGRGVGFAEHIEKMILQNQPPVQTSKAVAQKP